VSKQWLVMVIAWNVHWEEARCSAQRQKNSETNDRLLLTAYCSLPKKRQSISLSLFQLAFSMHAG
jgi:hypothetical protein